MRFRKYAIALIAAVILLAAAFIYFDARLLDQIEQTSKEQGVPQTQGQSGSDATDVAVGTDQGANVIENGGQGTSADNDAEHLKASENVDVDYNTAEYDIEVKLCENIEKKTFIRLQYYLNGISTVCELDEEQIPELTEIFENREKEEAAGSISKTGNGQPYMLEQVLLNPVQGQLYLLVNGAAMDRYCQASFYMVDLYDQSVKKLFSYPALYGKMSFSRNFSLLAYSFEDPPIMSMYQEDTLVEVFDCIRGEFIIRGSRNTDQLLLGSNSAAGYIYDYTFNSWKSEDVIKLKQSVRLKDSTDAEPIVSEVLYDIKKNLLMNTDGSKFNIADSVDEQEAGTKLEGADADNKAGSNNTGDDSGKAGSQQTSDGTGDSSSNDSEPVKQLKRFYACLASESDYDKAMKLLDEGFTLKLSMLKQFGVEEIHKSDIDSQYNEDNVSMYAELLKAAKFEKLTGEEISDDDVATINYFQILGLSEDSELSQPMTAKLEKKGKVWIIKSIEDGIK